MRDLPSAGIVTIDLHGKNAFQARTALDAALRRADKSVYRIHVVHGFHLGTAIRDLVRTEYAAHPRVCKLAPAGDGATDLMLKRL